MSAYARFYWGLSIWQGNYFLDELTPLYGPAILSVPLGISDGSEHTGTARDV